MKIQFTRNIQFTKLVKADGRLREFNFRKINSVQDGLFTVDVSDDRGNRIIFKVEKTGDTWKIEPPLQPLPEWVTVNEHLYHDLIEEEMKAYAD